jgi:predicted transcriptional regulator
MSRPLVVLPPDARVSDVRAEADAKRIHHFPILRDERLVGFVCTCDLVHASPEDAVLPLAWHHPATVSPACTVTTAARLLLMHGVGSLLVVDPSGLRGIVTADDLRALGPEVATVLEPARCAVCGAGEHLRPGTNGKSVCAYCKAGKPRVAKD